MNFLKEKDLANQWRNAAGLLLIFVTIFLFVFFNYSDLSLDLKKKLPTDSLLVAKVVETEEVSAGGDVLISPPKNVEPQLPEFIGESINPERFSSDSMIVKDSDTGFVFFRKNEYIQRPIASITKLMTAIVLLDQGLDWSATTTVIGADSLDTHVYKGDVYSIKELWQAGLVASSNKAILSLVNSLDLDEKVFIEKMNQKALELGMTDSYFTDPTGLNATNISTASDISILLDESLKYDEIKEALNKKELSLYSTKRNKNHHMWSTNWLLLGWVSSNFSGFTGGKTGYIPASGYNFTMQVFDEKGHTINVVVLGAVDHEARFIEARDIAQWTFSSYKWPGERLENDNIEIASSTELDT
ncbi:MAG: hypothetical protein GF349_04095 [Candidatus Magasanikbacteria bacterium]|nr:hypothetical protein [Candidatus Magasanikbacteria bacterium]